MPHINEFEMIEGIASQVRLARTSLLVNGWETDAVYECLFRLSGQPVVLNLRHPVHVEEGERLKLIGTYNSNNVFVATAYKNYTADVSGIIDMSPEEKQYINMLIWEGLLLPAAFLIIFPIFHLSLREYNWILWLCSGGGIIMALIGFLKIKSHNVNFRAIKALIDID